MRPSLLPVIWAYCLAHLDAEGYIRQLQHDIAATLQCHRDTVSRAFRQWRREGRLVHVGQRWEQATDMGNPFLDL